MRTKYEIRKESLSKRDSLTQDELQNKNNSIRNALFSLKYDGVNIYDKCQNILIYASYKSEVSTIEIIEKALSDGKKVFCPKVLSLKNGHMEFYRIRDIKEMVTSKMGILEPDTTVSDLEAFDTDTKGDTLMIMPGTAFNRVKDRIGYNGGFYDRYAARFENIIKVAIAFDVQIFDEDFPVNEYDRKPDLIITESEIIK